MANAKYKSIAALLQEQIRRGSIKEGEKLSTEMALMQQYDVSRQTVRHALQLLEQEGYVTSVQGSGTYVGSNIKRKSKNTSRQVAVILSTLSDYIFPSIIQGIESTLAEYDYTLTLKATNYRHDTERQILESLLESPPAGIILEGNKTALPCPNISLYKSFEECGVPIVFMHATYRELVNSTSATANDFQGGWDAVAHLYAHGHRSIGGIFKSTDNQGIQRYRGVIEAMQHYGLHYSDDAFLWFQDNSQLESLLKTDLPLTRLAGISAMVCYNDQVSRQILQALAPHGICVPDELSIISFDNSIFAEYTQPPLTSLSHPKAKLGQAAAETLISMISGKAVHSPVLDWELITRGSVAEKTE